MRICGGGSYGCTRPCRSTTQIRGRGGSRSAHVFDGRRGRGRGRRRRRRGGGRVLAVVGVVVRWMVVMSLPIPLLVPIPVAMSSMLAMLPVTVFVMPVLLALALPLLAFLFFVLPVLLVLGHVDVVVVALGGLSLGGGRHAHHGSGKVHQSCARSGCHCYGRSHVHRLRLRGVHGVHHHHFGRSSPPSSLRESQVDPYPSSLSLSPLLFDSTLCSVINWTGSPVLPFWTFRLRRDGLCCCIAFNIIILYAACILYTLTHANTRKHNHKITAHTWEPPPPLSPVFVVAIAIAFLVVVGVNNFLCGGDWAGSCSLSLLVSYSLLSHARTHITVDV